MGTMARSSSIFSPLPPLVSGDSRSRTLPCREKSGWPWGHVLSLWHPDGHIASLCSTSVKVGKGAWCLSQLKREQTTHKFYLSFSFFLVMADICKWKLRMFPSMECFYPCMYIYIYNLTLWGINNRNIQSVTKFHKISFVEPVKLKTWDHTGDW